MRFLTWLASTALALAAATWLIDGIHFDGPTRGLAEVEHKFWPLLGVALVLGVVSALVKPVVKFFSFPVIILTLGLFLLVINALMLLLVEAISGGLGIGFHVDGFWPAVWGGLIIAIVHAGLNAATDDD
ncbi:MAG: phage holin family protein [Nocardioides sp.]